MINTIPCNAFIPFAVLLLVVLVATVREGIARRRQRKAGLRSEVHKYC